MFFPILGNGAQGLGIIFIGVLMFNVMSINRFQENVNVIDSR